MPKNFPDHCFKVQLVCGFYCRVTFVTNILTSPSHLSGFLLVINRSLAVLTDYRISREQLTTGKDQPARYVLTSDQWSKVNGRLKWLNLKNY
jgi:hypothetical protein